MGGLKSFGVMLGSFFLVYFGAPYIVAAVVRWASPGHSVRFDTGLCWLVSIIAYALLRRRFGDRLPHI